jgi:guanylate kinase
MMSKGLLIVLSGPSGVGKGTVCTALRSSNSEIVYSVSATTRQPRDGEVEGINYFYKSHNQFREMIEHDELLEWAEYVGNYYGTPRSFVNETIHSGNDIILEIEVQGALQVKERFPQGVFIFLLPPSLEELKSRITNRGTESEQTISDRMNVAVEELKLLENYDYAVVNDKISSACSKIQAIITAEHSKRERMLPQVQKWIAEA